MADQRLGIGGNRRLPGDAELPREPDTDVLAESIHGPYHKSRLPRSPRELEDIREELWEVLKRMDEKESVKFARFVGMLSSLSIEEVERIYKIVKVFGFLRWMYGGFKWLILAFIGGIGAMATGGEQIEKIIGYIKSMTTLLKGLRS